MNIMSLDIMSLSTSFPITNTVLQSRMFVRQLRYYSRKPHVLVYAVFVLIHEVVVVSHLDGFESNFVWKF
jgi:hypothetical protein